MLFRHDRASRRSRMRLRRLALPLALAAGLGACGPTISSINARPDKFYQHKVKFTGRIARTQVLPGETLLEIADRRGARIIVRSTAPVEAGADDWVKVTGLLVPETRVGDAVLYDIVLADRIVRTRAPRAMTSMPTYGRRTSGTTTLPSGRW